MISYVYETVQEELELDPCEAIVRGVEFRRRASPP